MGTATTNVDIDQGALEFAAIQLQSCLGSLADLPDDLANTVANIYYLNALFLKGHPRYLAPYLDPNGASDHAATVELSNKSTADMYAVGDYVQSIRQMQRGMQELAGQSLSKAEAIYDFCVVATLDTLKWGLKEVNRKTAVRRSIERRFATSHEIEGMVERLNAAGFELAARSQGSSAPGKIIIECPSCHQRLRVTSGANLVATCPKCQKQIDVPARCV